MTTIVIHTLTAKHKTCSMRLEKNCQTKNFFLFTDTTSKKKIIELLNFIPIFNKKKTSPEIKEGIGRHLNLSSEKRKLLNSQEKSLFFQTHNY